MTAAKSTMRRRRSGGENGIPRELAEWFAGHRQPAPNRSVVPWSALLTPDNVLLPERWRAWSAENPGVAPPEDFEWLADPNHPRQPTAAVVAQGRAMLARRGR